MKFSVPTAARAKKGLGAGCVPANHRSMIIPNRRDVAHRRFSGSGFYGFPECAAAPQGADRENQMGDWTGRFYRHQNTRRNNDGFGRSVYHKANR